MGGRVVVLTGASGGIGRSAALAFAARGDRLVLAARGRERLEQLAARCDGAEVLVVPTDVTSGAAVDALVEAAVERFGRIDVWVDSAAVMAYGRFEDLPAAVFDRMIETHVLGAANMARAALRVFRGQGAGTLILTGSLLGSIAVPYMSAYVAGKWAHRALARTLRLETRDAPDIHVCLVAPGSVDTPIYTSAANYAGHVGRPPPPVDSPERVARAIVRLAEHPRAVRSVGVTNGFVRFGFTALPGLFDVLVGPLMRRLALSRETAPPTDGNVFGPVPPVEGGPGRWGRAAVLTTAAVAAAVTASAVRTLRRSR